MHKNLVLLIMLAEYFGSVLIMCIISEYDMYLNKYVNEQMNMNLI